MFQLRQKTEGSFPLPGGERVSFKLHGDEVNVQWTGGGEVRKPLVEITIPIKGATPKEVVTGLRSLFGNQSLAQEKSGRNLRGDSLENLMDIGRVTRIENCVLKSINLGAIAHKNHSLALKHVDIVDSAIDLTTTNLNLEGVKVKNSSLNLTSDGGVFDGVDCDLNTTLRGSLGRTRIDRTCTFREVRAEKMDFREVRWDGQETLEQRTKGMMFETSLVDLTVFEPISRTATHDDLLAANFRQNQVFTALHLMEALCSSPIGGNATLTNRPTAKRFTSSDIREFFLAHCELQTRRGPYTIAFEGAAGLSLKPVKPVALYYWEGSHSEDVREGKSAEKRKKILEKDGHLYCECDTYEEARYHTIRLRKVRLVDSFIDRFVPRNGGDKTNTTKSALDVLKLFKFPQSGQISRTPESNGEDIRRVN